VTTTETRKQETDNLQTTDKRREKIQTRRNDSYRREEHVMGRAKSGQTRTTKVGNRKTAR